MIRPYADADLEVCLRLFMEAYNSPPWNNHWTVEIARRYLREVVDHQRFVGYVLVENDTILGAALCHEKTWWTNDELFVDEFYIAPEQQRKGYGTQLLHAIEEHCRQHALGGYTLLTNRYMPAREFYAKHGLVQAEHVIFMYKEI